MSGRCAILYLRNIQATTMKGNQMRVMLIESKVDELIDERYKDTIMAHADKLVHWDTLEISQENYQRYEDLRTELYELIETLKSN
jgi:hypothetical protein